MTTTRRRFLKQLVLGGAGLAFGGLALGFTEPFFPRVLRVDIAVPRLPAPFSGMKVAFLTDMHHGPWTGLGYVRAAIERTNALEPDLILLGGDYVHRHPKYIAPCLAAHGALRAPLGVYGVLGNHDHWEGARATREALRRAGIVELTNEGRWLEVGGARLRIGGVGDLWEDTQDLDGALGDATEREASIVLSHNPDFAEAVVDPRVGLIFAGHTHGGQVDLPWVGAPRVPSRYGQKYLHGLVQARATQVFVSRGLGCITPPVRLRCRPEICLATLV